MIPDNNLTNSFLLLIILLLYIIFFSHLTTHQHNVIKSQTFKCPSRHPPVLYSLPIKYLPNDPHLGHKYTPNDPQTTENMLQIKNHSQILKTAPKTGQNRLQPVSQKPVKTGYYQSAKTADNSKIPRSNPQYGNVLISPCPILLKCALFVGQQSCTCLGSRST